MQYAGFSDERGGEFERRMAHRLTAGTLRYFVHTRFEIDMMNK